jgi:hypothetical protein
MASDDIQSADFMISSKFFLIERARSLVQPKDASQIVWNPINALTFEIQYPKSWGSMESANVGIPCHATRAAVTRIVMLAR